MAETIFGLCIKEENAEIRWSAAKSQCVSQDLQTIEDLGLFPFRRLGGPNQVTVDGK